MEGIHRSPDPPSPSRSEAKVSVVPSHARVGWKSLWPELKTSPRVIGVDHGRIPEAPDGGEQGVAQTP